MISVTPAFFSCRRTASSARSMMGKPQVADEYRVTRLSTVRPLASRQCLVRGLSVLHLNEYSGTVKFCPDRWVEDCLARS